MKKIIVSICLAVTFLVIVFLQIILAQEPPVTGEVEIRWTDPAVITGPIIFNCPISQTIIITQYIDYLVTDLNDTEVLSRFTRFDVKSDEAQFGQAWLSLYEFNLEPGQYKLYGRLRIEITAEYLRYGFNENNLIETDLRTFYGYCADMPTNNEHYCLLKTAIVLKFENMFLPIILKDV